MKRSINGTLAFCLIFLAGCSKMCGTSRVDMSPEQVVEAYLDTSLNMTDIKEKQRLLSLTSGNLQNAIASAPNEIIEQAFINKHYHLERYSVVERRDRTPRETEITFELVYRNLGDKRATAPEDSPQITTENTVSVVKEKGMWRIRDVVGKKTAIDFPVREADKITPGHGDPAGDAAPASDPAAVPAGNPR